MQAIELTINSVSHFFNGGGISFFENYDIFC